MQNPILLREEMPSGTYDAIYVYMVMNLPALIYHVSVVQGHWTAGHKKECPEGKYQKKIKASAALTTLSLCKTPAATQNAEQISSDPCSICLGSIRVAIRLPCSHAFCKECLDHWRNQSAHNNCPTCRALMPPSPAVLMSHVETLFTRHFIGAKYGTSILRTDNSAETLEQVIVLSERVIAEDPENTAALGSLAQAAMCLGQSSQAAKALKLLLKAPGWKNMSSGVQYAHLVNYGCQLSELNKYQQATKVWDKAVKISAVLPPSNGHSALFYNYGSMLEDLGDYTRAESFYRAGVKANGDHVNCLVSLACRLQQLPSFVGKSKSGNTSNSTEWHEARRLLEHALDCEPGDSRAMTAYFTMLVKDGQFEK
jgi:tetratricopeptide (TPR) repeat protein